MKTQSLLVTALFIFLIASFSMAGVKKIDDKKAPGKRTEIIVKKLTELLKLSTDQAGKVKEIIMLREKQRDADLEKFQKDEGAMKKASRERNKIANDRLKTILTDQQFQDLRKWRQAMADAKKGKAKEKENKEDNEQLIRELETE